jgi:hypothetical protein
MQTMGLSPADRRKFEAALAQTHAIRIDVSILDQNEKVVGSLSAPADQVLDGAVQYDATQDVTRRLDLSILDPQRKLHLDPDSPAQATLWPDRFVKVTYGVWVNTLEQWVDVPVFYGPLTRYHRDGAEVQLEGFGKELLALEPNLLWRTRNFAKGANIRSVVKQLMAEQGETKFALGPTNRKLVRRTTVKRRTAVWLRCQQFAKSLDRQLYYDGEGYLRWRKKPVPKNPVFIFQDGGGEQEGQNGLAGLVLGAPTVENDFLEFANVVIATGGTPRGAKDAKKRLRYTAVAPASHQLSPQKLKRNGIPRRVIVEIEDSHWNRMAKLREAAESELQRRLSLAQTIQFECLPVPHLEELDPVRLRATMGPSDIDVVFLLKQWTLPLTSDSPMTVGYNRRIVRRRRRKKNAKRKGGKK